ncbi:MAG TPA: glycosyltransferase family 39 protein [Gaiellaceae bacterium]|nr:glycosyltransferase family 39 protein [Gaiellaceae bacterium]
MLVLGLRAFLRAPLNVDEELTLRIAGESLGSIFHIVSSERGGGPVHFWLEHATRSWPGGLAGLRLPSLLALLAALPAAALVAAELAGRAAAAAAVLLLGAAPLAVSYSTFGRPHALLLAWTQWGTALGLLAARRGGARLWVAAGAVLGSSVFAHPTAPLYALVAFAGAVLYARRPLRAWPGAVALAVTLVPYEAATLHVLRDRYGVGGGESGRTFSGNPVWHDALHVVAPGRHDLNWLSAAAAAGLAALLARRRGRAAAVLVLTVVAPVVFFSAVPTSGTSGLFFDRYMLPALPAFLTLAAAGCVAGAQLAWRLRVPALVLLVAGLLTVELRPVLTRQSHLARLGLGTLTAAVRDESDGAVLFGSAGSTRRGGFLGAFTFGRPAALADRYLSLRLPGLPVVNDDTCVPVVAFLRDGGPPRRGVWVFYAAYADQLAAAERALAGVPGVGVRTVAGHFLLAASATPASPRALVGRGLALRRAWLRAVPSNRRAALLVAADRTALDAPSRCRPVGILGDPDLDPHYPLRAP